MKKKAPGPQMPSTLVPKIFPQKSRPPLPAWAGPPLALPGGRIGDPLWAGGLKNRDFWNFF